MNYIDRCRIIMFESSCGIVRGVGGCCSFIAHPRMRYVEREKSRNYYANHVRTRNYLLMQFAGRREIVSARCARKSDFFLLHSFKTDVTLVQNNTRFSQRAIRLEQLCRSRVQDNSTIFLFSVCCVTRVLSSKEKQKAYFVREIRERVMSNEIEKLY